MNLNIDFKNHIQSLRGISVILVIFYHLNIDYFSKGYLGVDIFLVISGYVITQRLYKDYLENKKISIMNFYLRRFFRIFPNLFFIVSFVYVFYLIFGPPDKSLYKSAIFSIFGLSNLFFLFENKNYFDTLLGNLLSDPLAHTWSLGIEEQFYLIYPFILFVCLASAPAVRFVALWFMDIGYGRSVEVSKRRSVEASKDGSVKASTRVSI